jgi:hypothetical protein
VLAQSAYYGSLYIAGTAPVAEALPDESTDTLACDCILCDDEDLAAGADTNVSVYVAGRFNKCALTWKQGYSPSMGDINDLRERNILLAADFD